MPIQALEPRRLYRQIAEQIAALIKRGEFRPGARLPPERDLAKQLGVSRPSVREALIALEVEGYVEVRIGSGVYVQSRVSRPAASRVTLPPDSGPFELIDARRFVESECAAMAARHALPAHVREMKAALAGMRRDTRSRRVPLDNDQRFHQTVAEASGNSAMAMLVRTLWAQRTGPLFLRLEHHFDTPALWTAAIDEHQAVLDAVVAGDGAAARQAMRRHLDRAGKRFKVSFAKNG